MKSVRDLPFFKNIREIREFEFGVFYYFDGLVIGEMKEGVHMTWGMAKKAVKAAKEIYGQDLPIAYISNRIHNYTVVPSDWIKFYTHRHQLDFYAVVGTPKGSFTSIVLEKMFFQNSIIQFTDIEEAIEWSVQQIGERRKKVQGKASLASNME
ncbi:hypothetical protein [Flagellimonas lutaonensis]|uniref:STAS/SEC14 domain-containing protein n=1 Tax=Flagellimonas lutaonensis TaxID=516051 RepID=A0A0D5YT49_9FLAO|nr:hypothetical protein [Allomuricauda lutaonensis]AKA35064.1 hypothetical protein VC82_1442 [Allomuricauda lutaonensis]